ncbi:hypothetical protein [Pseudooceanicola algae]|uniref:hypothetical protein n=1 Tax=Pseudooceanicola algae TaxID=1537215 RepID=UPI0018AD20EB|nr:hypothetical protein [Pseudooceanicola algae]
MPKYKLAHRSACDTQGAQPLALYPCTETGIRALRGMNEPQKAVIPGETHFGKTTTQNAETRFVIHWRFESLNGTASVIARLAVLPATLFGAV